MHHSAEGLLSKIIGTWPAAVLLSAGPAPRQEIPAMTYAQAFIPRYLQMAGAGRCKRVFAGGSPAPPQSAGGCAPENSAALQ